MPAARIVPRDLARMLKWRIRHRDRAGTETAPLFGLGGPKTGTHTLGEMFAHRIRSAHEADAQMLIRLQIARDRAGAGPDRILRALRLRGRIRGLRIDSSSVNLYLIDEIEQIFPGARYLVTLRPPIGWMRSLIDHSVFRDLSPTWAMFRDYRFGPREGHPPAEATLEAAGLHHLRGYLAFWRFAVETPLDRIPADRRLLVPTARIAEMAREIAVFAGLDPATPPATTHSYPNPDRSDLLAQIDRAYLLDLVEAEAGPAARRVFPDWSAEADLDRALAGGLAGG